VLFICLLPISEVTIIQTPRPSHRLIDQISKASLLGTVFCAASSIAFAESAQAKPTSAKNTAPLKVSSARHKAATDAQAKARVSLARARQLEQSGVVTLAERQLLHAVALAPKWIDAQRELAHFYTRQSRWKDAFASWRNVLFLDPNNAEAKAQFDHARRLAGSPASVERFADKMVELGQSSHSTMSSAGSLYTRDVARTTPRGTPAQRLAQRPHRTAHQFPSRVLNFVTNTG